MGKRRTVKLLGFLLSGLLFYLAIRGMRWELFTETLSKLDLKLIFVPILFVILSCAISSAKWKKIAGYGVEFKEAFVSLMIGLFINNVLPARIGEIARAYVLSKKKAISFTYSVSTVLLDRFFDLIGLLLLTFLFFPRSSLPSRISGFLIGFVGFMLLCVGILISATKESFLSRIVERLAKKGKPFSQTVIDRILEIHNNLKRINSTSNIAYLSLLAFLQWFSMSVSLYLVIRCFKVPVNPLHVPFVCAVLNMGITLPSSPGYIGLYQFLLVYLLSIFGVPKHESFPISIVYHAIWYLPYNVLGLIFLLSEQLRLKELSTLKR